jgi:hypothetical protein
MARFLLSLTLLLTLLRSNDVQANTACYCTYYPGDGRCHVNTTCWACAPGAYDPNWQSTFCLGGYQAPVQTCQQVSETQTQSCPANYTGQITQTRVKTCPDNQWQAWTTTQNSCVANPPTCQISSQQQTLSCQTGYTGSITQTRSSTCPDPYGSPTWQPWVTTSDTCKKSINNPTNPASPVSPLSPASNTSAPTTPSSPVTAPTPNSVPNSETTPTASTETSQTQTTTGSATTSTTQVSQSPPPRGKVRSSVGLVLSLELFQKPGIQQPNVFPDISIVKGIPNEILTQDLIMMDLLQQPSFNQPFNAPDLGFEQ